MDKRSVIKCVVVLVAIVVFSRVIIYSVVKDFRYKSTHEVSERIIDYLEDNGVKSGDRAIISVGDFTDFDWDTVAIYWWPVTAADMKRVTGIEDTKIEDSSVGIVFAKNHKVVYEETYDMLNLSVDYPLRFELWFESEDGSPRRIDKWKKEDAIFGIAVGKYHGDRIYTMYPIHHFDYSDMYEKW